MSKLDHALALAGRGFRVFPLDINSKIPAHASDWQKLASTDPDRIRSMWTDPVFDVALDYNIGVALDKDTLVVDVDVRDGKRGAESLALLEAIYDPLPATYTVATASGGQHRYFRIERDSGTFPKELASHIDLKGAGGYVVGPGSTIDGREYRTVEAIDATLAPAWVNGLPAASRPDRKPATGTTAAELDTPGAIARATEWLTAAAPEAIEGAGGNRTTYEVAARVKDFGISREKCVDLMLDWNDAKASPPWDPDEMEAIVGNAYRYGQNAPGIASPEAEFGPVEIDRKPPPKRRGLYAVRWDDARPVLDRPYLIDDLLDLGAMSVTYGDSNVGKTYVVLDQARAIAQGVDWNGHKVTQGLVVYIAAEGGSGFLKRIEAYRRDQGLAGLPFALVPCPVDLHAAGEVGDTDRLIRLIKAEEAHFGCKCVLVVVDTLARSIGAGDENTSVDMGLLVRQCDRLRAAIGATINLIHHTGKDKSKGARGSSALRAATDTEIEVREGEVEVQKQRDMARGKPLYFKLREVPIGRRGDGREATSCVVDWVAAADFEDKLTDQAQAMLCVLEELEAENDRVTWSAWKAATAARVRRTRGGHAGKRLFEWRRELLHAELVEQVGNCWRTKADKSDK